MQNPNFDVLNSLNLMCRSLGDAYLSEGYNPFDEDYVLTPKNALRLIQNSSKKREIKLEDFLEQSNQSIAQNFEYAKNNTEVLLQQISDLPEFKNFKDLKVFLKNRKKLLADAIQKLKNGNISAFDLYSDIVGLDVEYSEIMKKSFFADFNLQITIRNFLSLINQQTVKKTPEKEAVIAKIRVPAKPRVQKKVENELSR